MPVVRREGGEGGGGFQRSEVDGMFRVRHECGGIAHLVGKTPVHGWNLYCCDRCGESYYRWVTQAMLALATKPGG